MSFDWMKIRLRRADAVHRLQLRPDHDALIQKIAARAGGRYGIPIWQNYVDIFKNLALRSKITHGVMFYLGPVFRLTGGIGLLLFVPTIYGSKMEPELLLFRRPDPGALFRLLRHAGHGARRRRKSAIRYAAIGVSRGLSQVTMAELPLALAVYRHGAALRHARQSPRSSPRSRARIFNWTLFTSPLAVAGRHGLLRRHDDAPALRRGAGAAGNSRSARRPSTTRPIWR